MGAVHINNYRVWIGVDTMKPQHDLFDVRCPKCNGLMGKIFGIAELWCRKCKLPFNAGIVPASTGFELKVVECLRAPGLSGVRDDTN